MNRHASTAIDHLRVDGGASVMDLLLQTQADQIDVAVTRSAESDSTALGAAYLAGLAEGVWDSPTALASQWRSDGTFVPQAERRDDGRYQRWQEAVKRCRGWAASSEVS